MSSMDRALAALDEGLELAAAPHIGYPTRISTVPETCWRCTISWSETDVGLCEACRDEMRDETVTAPEPSDDPFGVLAEHMDRMDDARAAARACLPDVRIVWLDGQEVEVVTPPVRDLLPHRRADRGGIAYRFPIDTPETERMGHHRAAALMSVAEGLGYTPDEAQRLLDYVDVNHWSAYLVFAAACGIPVDDDTRTS